MIESEYYQNYKGPKLTNVTFDKIDVTDRLIEIYGENNNWHGCLWTYREIFGDDCINKHFQFNFVGEDGRKHWFHGFVTDIEQYFNPPLATPMNQNVNP